MDECFVRTETGAALTVVGCFAVVRRPGSTDRWVTPTTNQAILVTEPDSSLIAKVRCGTDKVIRGQSYD